MVFHDLRAEGAFLIGGVWSAGQPRWVSVKSLAAKPCLIQPGFQGDFQIKGNGVKATKVSEGTYELSLKKDDEVILYTGAKDFLLQPVRGDPAKEHFYGWH